MTTRIACAGISGRILQGRVTADGKSFSGQKKDVTSDVLAAVIDKLKHHGGSFTIHCNGEPVATLTLSDPAAQDQGEVQRLRELLGRALDRSDYATSTLRPGGNYPDEYVCHACLADTQAAWKDGNPVADGHKQISHEPDCWAEEARALLARLAASTGQEVKP